MASGRVHRIEAVLLDLGGVWLQDGDFTPRAEWAARHGLSADELFETYQAAIGPGWEGGRTEDLIHRDLLERLGLDRAALPGLLDVLHAHETLDPTVTEFIAGIRSLVRVGVITNAGPSARRQLCAKFPLEQLTDTIVVSAEEGVSKPDPRIYRTACGRLAVEPGAAVFVDDKQANVEGARAIGMQAITFTSPTETVARLSTLLGVPSRRAPDGPN
jgi:epoxide hydrolase-like predicted phosphatase